MCEERVTQRGSRQFRACFALLGWRNWRTMPARVRSFLAAAGALLTAGLAFGSAAGEGMRGDALPLPSAAPRLERAPLAPTRADCQRLAPPPPVPRPPAPFGLATLADRGGRGMNHFYAALSQAAVGRGLARIMYFGDSHVASDLMTGRIRHTLQSRFGDGGVGFFLPSRPVRWYAHADIDMGRSAGWDVLAVRKSHDLERRVGPAGFALFTHGEADAAVRLHAAEIVPKPSNRTAQLQVYYLQQPAGGHVRAIIDGSESRLWTTASEGMVETPGYFETALRRMPQRLEINAVGDGPVTLYGMTLERSTSGVVLDTLGIPGARAKDHLLWDDEIYREHMIRREPDLVVLAYGTNEGTDSEPIETFESNLRHVVSRVRETVPQASCLLVGPTDHPQRVGRSYRLRKRTGQIVEAERRIAAEHACGFIDLVSVMGGPMSMMRIVAARFAGPDHTHLTRRGYEALADAISGAVVTGWSGWQRTACTDKRDEAVLNAN